MSCIPITSFGLPEWGNSTSSSSQGIPSSCKGTEDDFCPPLLHEEFQWFKKRKMTMKMNAFTVVLLSLLLVPMSLVANGAETNSVRSLMGIKLGEHEDFMHSPRVLNSIINGRGNFREGKDGDVDCRITENRLRTPFRFFDRVCVYSTPDTRVIYKIELPCQAAVTPDEFFRVRSDLASSKTVRSDLTSSKTLEIIKNLGDVRTVLSKKYGEEYRTDGDFEKDHKCSKIFKFIDSEMRLDIDIPLADRNRNGFDCAEKEGYFASVKLSLVDVKLVQHVKEATKKAIETKARRQKFIEDGGLL